jgi:tRNA A-37 threonylcarbamoyl transferase component Bud32
MDPQKVKKKVIKDLSTYIPEIQDKDNPFSLKRLTSKKNIVFELDFKVKLKKFPKVVILKLFRTEFAEKEYNALTKLGKLDIAVPKVLYFNKPYIILEKLNGVNLCDLINDNLIKVTSLDELDAKMRNKIIQSVKSLAEWIANLHKQNVINNKDPSQIIVLNKGDTRLRDFIYDTSKKEIYGIDFEESYEGNHHDDLTWICCSLIDTNPGLFQMLEPTHKIELINLFLKEYFRINNDFEFSFEYFAERLIEYLNIVIERRSLEYGPVNKDSILRSILKDY